MMPDESVTTMLVVPDFDHANYVTLITRLGRIKRMDLGAFRNVRSSGVIAMNLDDGDSLDWARLTDGDEEFIVVTQGGKALRFHESQVRPMGRTAAGVMAIRLLGDDQVVSMDVVKPDADLILVHERGWGKRSPLAEYSPKGRYTQGVWTTDRTRLAEIGAIVAARVVGPDDQVTIITSDGIILRTMVSGISRMGRPTRGVRVVNLQKGDSVAALAVLTAEDLARAEQEANGDSDNNEAITGEAVLVDAAGDAAATPTVVGEAAATAVADPAVASLAETIPDAVDEGNAPSGEEDEGVDD
jgi:DNA gyrase subunit A